MGPAEMAEALMGIVSNSNVEEMELVPNDPAQLTPLELGQLASEAKAFLQLQPWCLAVDKLYFERWVEGVLAVFFAQVKLKGGAPDELVWVITGDLPPAYLSAEFCRNGVEAIDGYVAEMKAWLEAAGNGTIPEDVMPVYYRHSLKPMEPTAESISLLEPRIHFLETKVLALYSDEIDDGGGSM